MRLDVDIGNTRLKWRLGGRGPGIAVAAGAWLESIDETVQNIDAIYVCSVADSKATGPFVEECRKRWGVEPQFAQVSQGLAGLRVAYDDPQQLGVDRWLAMLAAKSRFPDRRFVVISAGTALTVDLVDESGRHCGGYIAPGLGLSKEALLGRAARLKAQQVQLSEHPEPGCSTPDCLSAGFSVMYQAFLRRVLSHPTFGEDAMVLFTGGDASSLFSITGFLSSRHLLPDLVLSGLLQVFPSSAAT